MPAVPRARFISELLDIHAEDLAFLWGERRTVLDSQENTLRDYTQLTERIEAHIQGLLVAPAAALRERLEAQLAISGERDDVFAASVAALRCDDAPTARYAIAEFSRATGPALLGLRDALGQASARVIADELRKALDHAKPATAAAAAVALANQQLLDNASPRLARLLSADNPEVCACAWRAALLADVRARKSAPSRPYREGLSHAAPAVRHAAWACAAWTGQPQALATLRRTVSEGDRVALHWLAVLGGPEDAKPIGQAALGIEDPGERCRLLARFGHPIVLNALVRWIEGEDPALAHAAGEAFMRITGEDIRGERKTLPVKDDADEFEREMAPLVWMPDAAKARRLHEERGPEWNQGTRWCGGRRLDDADLSAETLRALDLQARWDAAARAGLAGRRLSAPPPICD